MNERTEQDQLDQDDTGQGRDSKGDVDGDAQGQQVRGFERGGNEDELAFSEGFLQLPHAGVSAWTWGHGKR